ncbi:hypothetical protein FQN50_007609 [Emmonsiellopsis sp. PD_5]|nr:hypothetical protein FQN50_007609 [Emmonsiellopsis sp. PD_5]
MAPDLGRSNSQGSLPPQTQQSRPRTRQSTIEPARSRSNTAASRITRPSRSRGSTASIHSTTTQYNPDQHVADGYQPYIHTESGPGQPMYPSNPEEMIIRFGDQLANSHSSMPIDPALEAAYTRNPVGYLANVPFQGHELPPHGLPMHGLQTDIPHNGLPTDVHAGHYPQMYEGVESHIPDHIMADNDGSEAGPRKRRTGTSTLANENELRRLLRQYDGYSLHQMAAEVQKHDGSGGKSEKMKQVFAMICVTLPQQFTTVDSPASTTAAASKPGSQQSLATDHLCDQSLAPDLDITIELDPAVMETQQMMDHILQFTRPNEPLRKDNDSLQLPNIHQYLPPNTDVEIADALAALYRSHCISVIDSFRYCKEKNLFRHFASFQGTLTVPVHKLLTHPDIAAWVRECDWLMYQKMIAFVEPLTTQVVPDPVLNAFGSISRSLVSHIRDTFKSHPEHVAQARLNPARIFCHLLKRMLDVNQSAIAASAWLCHTDNRTRMWEDFVSHVDPMDLIAKANIPSCSVGGALALLRDRLKPLIAPVEPQSPDVNLYDQDHGHQTFSYSSSDSEGIAPFPDRWIAFILNLPIVFPHHKARCIIDKTDALWTRLLHRLTLGGAQSFSAWWMTKVFFVEMMLWQAEKGGFMNSTAKSSQKSLTNARVNHGRAAANSISSAPGNADTSSASTSMSRDTQSQFPAIFPTGNSPQQETQDNDVTMSTSPANAKSISTNQRGLNHDDSAIDLDDDSVLIAASKYGDMMASDPADAEGDVVVV